MNLRLSSHPATPPGEPAFDVWANVDHSAAFGASATLNLWFGVGAPASRFALPEGVAGQRVDELWRTTCFELFLRREREAAYQEWNFAPSGEWAAYEFSAYRAGMQPADVAADPYLRFEDNLTWFALGATIAVDADAGWQLGLSAVIEEIDGRKSYWALAHPPGDQPDFHAPDCFAVRLP